MAGRPEADLQYMREALALARRGRGRTSPNPMVGAVVVKGSTVVGRGFHARAGGPHAEVIALNEAGEQAQGATLYVTLEPCSHFGRTPPCVGRVIQAGIRRVVVAMEDPNPKVSGGGIRRLRRAGLAVEVGLLEEEARRLNEVFIKHIATGRPFVVLKTALTLDGKIATRTGHSRWVTGAQARAVVHRLRDEHDAILVGVGTVLKDDPRLTVRLEDGNGKDPVRVILDSRGRTPSQARVLTGTSAAPTLIATTKEARLEEVERLKRAGAEVLILPAHGGRVSWESLLEELAARGCTSLLIEGGAEVNASALAAGVVDKAIFFFSPKIVGGKGAPGPVGGTGVEKMSQALRLEKIRVRCIGEDFMVEGYVGGKLGCSPDS